MPGRDGLDLLAEIKDRWPSVAVVMVSGHGDAHTGFEAAARSLRVPREAALRGARAAHGEERAARSELQRDNIALKRKVDAQYQMLGRSKPMQDILALIERVGPAQARVLITARTARARSSSRVKPARAEPALERPFVEVNCAAIPSELIESELFGHEKAPSPARPECARTLRARPRRHALPRRDRRHGLVPRRPSAARAGDRHGQRVGAEDSHKVDVRVLAATNKDLAAEVAAGALPRGPALCLNVVEIHLPPLHERREDIPLLARHFLTEACRRNEIPARKLGAECEACSRRRSSTANVRQLRNLMERLAILANGDPIPASERSG